MLRNFQITKYIDLLFIILIISFLINDLFIIISSLIDKFNHFFDIHNFISFMSDNSSNVSDKRETITKIIHDDGSWSNAIRSLFIYSTGALRLHLSRGGTPGSRAFVIGSTILTDATAKVVNNIINDPEYVRNHYSSWKAIWNTANDVELHVDNDKETISKFEISKKFLSDNNGIDDYTNKLLNSIIDSIKSILEPIQVSYSNEILANQIYHLSIVLFIMSLLIIILIISFIINVFIFVYSDKVMNYFNNKYIKWYININKKFIGIELLFLGSSILYFMYTLSYGIHFIATHPISFT